MIKSYSASERNKDIERIKTLSEKLFSETIYPFILNEIREDVEHYLETTYGSWSYKALDTGVVDDISKYKVIIEIRARAIEDKYEEHNGRDEDIYLIINDDERKNVLIGKPDKFCVSKDNVKKTLDIFLKEMGVKVTCTENYRYICNF